MEDKFFDPNIYSDAIYPPQKVLTENIEQAISLFTNSNNTYNSKSSKVKNIIHN
jgi:hypothetical protein